MFRTRQRTADPDANPYRTAARGEHAALPEPDAEPVLFEEVQRLHQNILLRLLLPIEMVFTLGIVLMVTYGAGKPMSGTHLAILLGAMAVPLPILAWGLRTRITPDEVRLWFWPGRWRISAHELDEIEPVTYDPLSDAGGWGIRSNRRFGRILNVAGERGVRITAGKRRFLIGSQRTEELAATLIAIRDQAREDAGEHAPS